MGRADFPLSDRTVGLLFIVPFVVTALFFMVYPIVEAIRLAFVSYNPLPPELSAFVGLANFVYIVEDPLFWDSFLQATIWTLLSILFQTVFGVGIALLLHQAQPHQRLETGDEDAALGEIVLVVERDVGERHRAVSVRQSALAARTLPGVTGLHHRYRRDRRPAMPTR